VQPALDPRRLAVSSDAAGGTVSAGEKPRWSALCVALITLVAGALSAFALSRPELIALLQKPEQRAYVWAAAVGFFAIAGLAFWVGRRAQQVPRGTPGRLRLILLGYCPGVFALTHALGLALSTMLAGKLPSGAAIALDDALWVLPSAYRATLLALAALLSISALLSFGALVAGWFLLPLRARRVWFALLDGALLVAFVVLSLRFELAPTRATPEAITGASLRLIATLLLGIRLAIRLLPWLLDGIELIHFRSLVAARHLRAKKSGFLAAISFLSILAVSVSSCALTTTLSVMGGFRQDLKRKILGNNAHIVVDRPEGKLEEYDALATQLRKLEGVRGVSPYLSGEVMISSASNLAGAVLRGIDLEHVGEVSELPRTMRVGSLAYLKDPEKLKSLPANQLGLDTGLPKATQLDEEDEAAPGKAARLSAEIEKMLKEPTQKLRSTAPSGLAASVPGIVVGQELARSLRLYLGDEVNVVTPLGELGPTGPMPKSRPFRVAGIFYSGMYEYDMKFAYVTLASAQRFLSAPRAASGVEITVREPDRAQDVATVIADRAARPGLRVRAWQELNKNLFGALALEKLAMFIALGIAILVASFCIVGTLTLMVQEKGREVAVLKAMGAADRAIVSIFVLEGTMIGVLGSLLGLGLGYAVCFAAEHFGIRLNPEVYYIDKLPVHIDPTEFLTVGVAAIFVSLLVTIYPAQLASRLRPVDALRYE
jgi:lipoprotein-releasing system permease protein